MPRKAKVPEEDKDEVAEASAQPEMKRRRRHGGDEEEAAAEQEADEDGDADDDEDENDSEEDVIDAGEEEDMCEDEEDDEDEEGASGSRMKAVFRPGIDKLEEGEELAYDPSTYEMLHRAQVDWPCLSFDVMRDDLGAQRSSFPMTAYIVAGTQAEQAADNRIFMMKWHKLYKTNKDGRDDTDEEDSEDEDSEDDHEAALELRSVSHPGGVNRIRCMPQAPHIVATWADTGKVHMWNLDAHKKSLNKPGERPPVNVKPLFTCDSHGDEGYAVDFNPHSVGRVLTGANDKSMFVWDPVQGGWKVDSANSFKGHTAAVEDVQWKRKGDGCQHVFASCSADRSFRVWDVRETNRKKSVVHVAEAHSSDVNVLCWSPLVGELLATGSDDGGFKVWDTRNTGAGPMANFMWHKKGVTSLDWHPTDETMLAVSADDDTVSIWDMAVEDDAEGGDKPPGAEDYPAQLMFLHMGQQELKELKWHPQLQGVCISTAGSGFNIFKTCNT